MLSQVIVSEEWENRRLDLRFPNRKIKGFGPTPLTQLMIYGRLGDVKKVQKLLEAGADPNIVDDNGTTALMHCLIGRKKDTALLLLNEDIKESIDSRTHKKRATALELAIDLGDIKLVEKTIQKGASVERRCSPDGEDGLTPLYYTMSRISLASNGISELKKAINSHDYLKALKIDDTAKFHSRALFDNEILALHETIKHNLGEESINDIYDFIFKTYNQNIPQYHKIIDILLENNADVNAKQPPYGFTPFLYSAEIGHVGLFKKLLEHGGKTDDCLNDGASILHLASGWRSLELTLYILENINVSAYLNTPGGKFGEYPIHHCINNFRLMNSDIYDLLHSILDKLLALKPNLNVEDNRNITPLKIAQELR